MQARDAVMSLDPEDIPGALALLEALEAAGEITPEVASHWRVLVSAWGLRRQELMCRETRRHPAPRIGRSDGS